MGAEPVAASSAAEVAMAPKGLRQPLHGRDWVGLWGILWLPLRVHYTVQATIRITIMVTVIKGHYARDYMGLRKIFFAFFFLRGFEELT